MCTQSGSPFGDSDVCYEYGMAYASLSMAVCKMLIVDIVCTYPRK